ncbi:MAG: DUF393 domain-containing protein [Pseudomonadota bacterium]
MIAGAAFSNRQSPKSLVVFYDGACPLCSREIDFYRRERGAETIQWVDVNSSDFQAQRPAFLTRDAALARFHVEDANGQVVSGIAAFRLVWARLAHWRWLAWLTTPRTIQVVLERLYSSFLKWRRPGKN